MPKLIPKPDLRFLRSTDQAGFTTARVTSFRRTSPLAIVRELVQNAFDASQEAKNTKAIVQFRLDSVKISDIPGIKSYKKTLQKARHEREGKGKKLNSQEEMIAGRMEDSLSRSEVPMLVVIDNGIGLSTRTMRALLADGISDKSDTSGGAFGNGHFAVFPISDLRYLLYAAINGSKQIASGHAILAWQSGCSANGYYISGTNSRDGHIYPARNPDIPKVIQPILKEVRENYKHGTAVAVPSFNYFCDDDHSDLNFCQTVARAVACSFFPAIEHKQLEVTLWNKDKILQSIDHANVNQVLGSFRDEKNLSAGFLSGFKACIAHKTMSEGRPAWIPVLGGKVRIYLQTPSLDGRMRVNLFRNGMWITNSDKRSGGLPGFTKALGDRQSFDAVLLVTAVEAPEFHDLIRNAEGPLHNEIDYKLLPTNEKKKIQEGFGQIWTWLRDNVSELSVEEYRSPHLLGIPEQIGGLGSGRDAGFFYHGAISTLATHQPSRGIARGETARGHGSGRGKNSGRRKNLHIRKILPNDFDIVAAPGKEKNQKTIYIYSHEHYKNMLLRLVVDENLDSTTDDNVWERHHVLITNVKCHQESGDIDADPDSGCVRIKNLDEGSTTIIDVTYKINEEIQPTTSSPSLRVVLEQSPGPELATPEGV